MATRLTEPMTQVKTVAAQGEVEEAYMIFEIESRLDLSSKTCPQETTPIEVRPGHLLLQVRLLFRYFFRRWKLGQLSVSGQYHLSPPSREVLSYSADR